jgi:hypothetical protein
MFCAPRPIFGGTESIGSRFHALCSRTHFERYRERRVQFSCFAFPDLFWVAPRDGGGPIFLFFAPRPVLDSTKDVGSRFHAMRFWTRFGQ